MQIAHNQPLADILDTHYPPLTYCHNQQDGYIGLDDYVELAKGVFNENQEPSSAN